MASAISFEGSNHGFQLGENHGHVSVQFLQSEISLNEACLRDLRTTDPHDDKNRIEQTKGGLLKDSYRWILDNEQFQQWQRNYSSRLLWIKGNPGKGKTMLLCGIINELTRSVANTANLSYFFCQATDGRINTATAVLRGLIYSLVEKQRSLLSYVRSQYDQAGKQIFEDINAWHAVSRIFTNILKDPSMQDTYLIIDALDECKIGLPSLLDFIVQELSAYPHVKWIVSSRNWPGIEEKLDTATQTVPISLELNETYVSEAVSNFIRHKVGQLAKTKKYDEKTRESIYHYFSLKSQGTFLWVALVCEELVGISRRNTLKKLKAFPPGLNALYGRMIDRIRALDEADAKLCMRVLAIISTAYRPLTLKELNVFLDEPEDDCVDDEDLSEIISRCGSFLIQCEETIYFVHQSAQDFLKALSDIFPKGIEAEHYTIFMRSFQFIFKTLQRDIYNIKAPGLPAEKVRQPSPNPLKVAQYACVYWVDHFQDGKCDKIADPNLHEGGCVDVFLRQKYLHWLEALSILGSVSYGITAMVKLDCLLQVKGESKALLRRVRDASRFIQYHRAAIESSPLQVYSSPLIFSPTQSLTRICYGEERPDWVLNDPVVEEDWSACLQSLEGHMGSIHSIAWSQDGTRLASASYDHTVRIWNPVTGQCASTLKGHIGSVNSIAWSPDGSQLASASDDKIIRNWDPATGQCVSILDGHMGSIHLIAWSQDGNLLASASDDKVVRIWDPATSQCVLTLEGHSDSVRSIAWSQDRTRLASASWDNTVKIWELVISQSALTLKGHSKSVNSIAWSQDGSRIASASDDKAVRIWDPATGQCISILEGHSDSVRSIAWSRDSSRLASASHDKTIRIWDPATGLCVLTLKGHSDWVNSIAWSQDSSQLASASHDKTVRIWDSATGLCVSVFEGHSHSVNSITWSQDGSRLASASWDNTVRIWEPAIGQFVSNLERHSDSIISIAWSRDGRRLASASADNTVRIWDPATGQCALILEGHSDWVNSIAWSQDGSRLASISFDSTMRIWDPDSGQCTSTLEGHSNTINSIDWSQDGSRLASASDDKTVRIWDPATGQCVSTLEGHSHSVTSISWSQYGWRLASASSDDTIRIWDPATGQCESTLQISSPSFLRFDQVNINHLHTTPGIFDIDPAGLDRSIPHCPSLAEQYGYGLNDDHAWITYNGANLLWLPAEYRPSSSFKFAIFGTTMAIGCSSGRVIFLALTEQSPIPGL